MKSVRLKYKWPNFVIIFLKSMRLDILLVKQGFFASRELAKYNISMGNVVVNGITAKKPSTEVTETSKITLNHPNALRFVSKGGLKLQKALEEFGISCKDFKVLDVGASTGGFTDCVLQNGAQIVYSVDVGTEQLSALLKTNPKVFSIENIHIKDLTPEHVKNILFDLIVTDLSFISLTKVFEYFSKFILPEGKVIALIKPQFEVGKQAIEKGGIVRKPKAHIEAIERISDSAKINGLYLTKITYSPLIESGRNIEYLALFERRNPIISEIQPVVESAFSILTKME